MKLLIWTRSTEDWEQDQTFIPANARQKVVHVPLITTHPLRVSVPQTPFQHAIFTSPKGVAYTKQTDELWALVQKCLHVYTFGDKTTMALEQLGLHVTQVQTPNAQGLATYLAEHAPRVGRYLILTAREPAYPLRQHLQDAGLECDAIAVYETTLETHLDRNHYERLVKAEQFVLCFASPSAVKAWLQIRAHHPELAIIPQIAVVMGESTAAACQSGQFIAIHTATQQTVEALWQRGWKALGI